MLEVREGTIRRRSDAAYTGLYAVGIKYPSDNLRDKPTGNYIIFLISNHQFDFLVSLSENI